MNTYILSVSGEDKGGLIAAITGCLYELGANCRDTNFHVLGQACDMNCIFDIAADIPVDHIRQTIFDLPEVSNSELEIKPFSFSTLHQENATITHRIHIQGGDHQGLLARLSEAFMQYQANIVRLSSRQVPGSDGLDYHIEMAVFIPQAREDACLATVGNTASSLQLSFAVEKI